MPGITRRTFLKSSAVTAAALFSGRPARCLRLDKPSNCAPQRLSTGWEYHQGALGSSWEPWRNDVGNSISWQSIELPHCFNWRDAVDPDQTYYQGPAWYRTLLKIDSPFPDGRVLLHFEGVGQKSEMYVYLEKVGEHHGGYDEFFIDITDAAAKASQEARFHGQVPVAVMCDNSRDAESIPSPLNDFTRYGGLYRHVNLVFVPAISIERVHVNNSVDSSGNATLSIGARLYNPAGLREAVQLETTIRDPKGRVISSASEKLAPWTDKKEIFRTVIENAELWSPSHPVLYSCEVKLTGRHGAMTSAERFGVRSFQFLEHGPFELNGERLVLRGTQRQEDHALVGAAMSNEQIATELRLIKEMGANFLGLGHHQQSRTVLDLCDELGLLVLEEIPWSRGGLGGDGYQQQAKAMLRAMIDQHFNHPSVIIWGLGNENDWPGDFPNFDRDKIRSFLKELNDEAHALDPSRKTFVRRCDFAKDIPDIYSPSIWAGWYRGRYTEYKSISQKERDGVPHFLHLEWGGDSHAGRHSEQPDRLLCELVSGRSRQNRADELLTGGQTEAARTGDWSESYICNLFDWCLKEQETMPWLTGTAQWIFKDFATPLRPDNPVPYVNQKGLVERDLTPKESYYVFQSYWSNKPMVHLYGHSWPTRWGTPDEDKLVKAYSNCETTELFLNGVSCGRKRRDISAFPASGFHWVVRFQPGMNHLEARGTKGSTTASDEIHFEYQTKRWGAPAKLELKELVRRADIVTLQTRLLDQNSVLCLDARNRVRFGITGDGTLVDDVGTSTGSRVVELRNGRAEISMRTNKGSSVVSVSAESFDTFFLRI